MEIESNEVVVDASSDTLKQQSSLLVEDTISCSTKNSTVSSSTNIQEKILFSETLNVSLNPTSENFIHSSNSLQNTFSENNSTESRT
jgi:hypothetical protein